MIENNIKFNNNINYNINNLQFNLRHRRYYSDDLQLLGISY